LLLAVIARETGFCPAFLNKKYQWAGFALKLCMEQKRACTRCLLALASSEARIRVFHDDTLPVVACAQGIHQI
jgi:hypothetical protein